MMRENIKRGPFFAVSMALHTGLVALLALAVRVPDVPAPGLVEVKIMDEAEVPANPDFQAGKIIDAPVPDNLKSVPPKEAEALARFDATATEAAAAKNVPVLHTDTEEFSAHPPRKERKIRTTPAETAKSESKKKSSVPENRFSDVQALASASPLPGAPSKTGYDPGIKTDRENVTEAAALSGEEIDRFASASPAGILDTGREIVIPLNTRKSEYIEYFSTVRRAVENVWAYPYEAMANGVGGRTVVRFSLLKNGSLEEAKVVVTSGVPILDAASMAAVRTSGPYPPFPANLDKEKIHIVAVFSYQPVFNKVP